VTDLVYGHTVSVSPTRVHVSTCPALRVLVRATSRSPTVAFFRLPGLLRRVGWFRADVSWLPVGPRLQGSSCPRRHLDL
jgi:hypothetical protein